MCLHSCLCIGVVDGCKSLSEYLVIHGFMLNGGTKKQYNERQCIERCREDNLCYAIDLDTAYPNTCYLYRKPKDSNTKYAKHRYLSGRETEKVIIFFDVLKLLDYSFKLENIHCLLYTSPSPRDS